MHWLSPGRLGVSYLYSSFNTPFEMHSRHRHVEYKQGILKLSILHLRCFQLVQHLQEVQHFLTLSILHLRCRMVRAKAEPPEVVVLSILHLRCDIFETKREASPGKAFNTPFEMHFDTVTSTGTVTYTFNTPFEMRHNVPRLNLRAVQAFNTPFEMPASISFSSVAVME